MDTENLHVISGDGFKAKEIDIKEINKGQTPFAFESLEDQIYAKSKYAYIAEIDLKIPKSRLKILFYLAQTKPLNNLNAIELQREAILKQTGTTHTNGWHHINRLLKDHLIKVTRQEPYRKIGNKNTFGLTTRGLVVTTICTASPVYDNLGLEPSLIPSPANQSVTIKCKQRKPFVEKIGNMLMPSYDQAREPVKIPNLYAPRAQFYVRDLPLLLETNQHMFLINYNSLNAKQQEIAKKSAIFAAYDFIKDWRFSYYAEDESIPRFTHVFFSEPIISKWENWEDWLELIREEPILKKRFSDDWAKETEALREDMDLLHSKIASVEEAMSSLNKS